MGTQLVLVGDSQGWSHSITQTAFTPANALPYHTL